MSIVVQTDYKVDKNNWHLKKAGEYTIWNFSVSQTIVDIRRYGKSYNVTEYIWRRPMKH